MSSSGFHKLQLQNDSPSLLIGLLTRLFAVGIFSTEGGAKAWFELTLVTAALCACGYILWWQVPLIIIAILLGTLAAGMISVLAPEYVETTQLTGSKSFSASLKAVSGYNLEKVSNLTGNELIEHLEVINKARAIFSAHPDIADRISDFQEVLTNIEQSLNVTSQKIQNEQLIRIFQRQQEEAEKQEQLRRQQREAERQEQLRQQLKQQLKRQQEEVERKRQKEQAEKQNTERQEQLRQQLKRQQEQLRRQHQEAERRQQQEQPRQQQEDRREPNYEQKSKQPDIVNIGRQQKQQEQGNQLHQARRKAGYSSGHPPYTYAPKQAPPGYPIKVTASSRDGKYKGIYYRSNDPEYHRYDAHWWFESPSHAAQNGFRRPILRDGSGRFRP